MDPTAAPSASIEAVCPHCGTVNRIPAARVADAPSCGRCGEPVFTGAPLELTERDFDRFAQRNGLPVVVDFWAPWCGPCRAMAPQFEQAARRLSGRVQFAKVNTDVEPELAQRFAIRSIPTIVMLHGGREVRRASGAMTAAQLQQWLAAG